MIGRNIEKTNNVESACAEKEKTKLLTPTFRILLVDVLLAITLSASAARLVNISPYISFSAAKLVDRGDRFLKSNQPDSALVCFILAGRKAESIRAYTDTYAKAMLGQWRIFFFYYYDYAKAYSALSAADTAQGASPKVKAAVYSAFGNMYQTFYSYSSDTQLGRKATNYYRLSIRSQVESHTHDTETLASTFVNLADMCFWLHNANSALPYLRLVVKQGGSNEPSIRFCRLLCKALAALENGRTDEAVAALRLQEGDLPRLDNNRFALVHYQNLALAYEQKGDKQQAIACYDELKRCADANGGRDAVLLAYEGLMRLYEQAGNHGEARVFRDRYYCLRDSIMNVRAMMSINNIHFLAEIKKAEDTLNRMEERHDRMVTILAAAIILILAVSIFVVVLWRKNRILHDRNNSLYQRYQQTLRPSVKPQTGREADAHDEELMEKIKNAMLADVGIFESGYSIDRLAASVGEKTRTVSETINRVYGDNFYALLNSYRIREACRRINAGGNTSRLTIEGIAHSVGFKSRTSFLNYFKRNTGITPSEYIRIRTGENDKQ